MGNQLQRPPPNRRRFYLNSAPIGRSCSAPEKAFRDVVKEPDDATRHKEDGKDEDDAVADEVAVFEGALQGLLEPRQHPRPQHRSERRIKPAKNRRDERQNGRADGEGLVRADRADAVRFDCAE